MSNSTSGASRKAYQLLLSAVLSVAFVADGLAEAQLTKAAEPESEAIKTGSGSDITLLNSQFSNTKIVVTPYAFIQGNEFQNVHFVIDTKDKAAINNNRFERGCWFTIDGVDYKTPDEIKRARTILEKSPAVSFLGNYLEGANQATQTDGVKP